MKKATSNRIEIGKCIYCDTDSDTLNEEHPIPVAIGGNLSLVRSSCLNCERTINRFEQRFLRNAWGAGRATLPLVISRKKKRAPAKARFVVGKKVVFSEAKNSVGALPFLDFGRLSDVEYGTRPPAIPQIKVTSKMFWRAKANKSDGQYQVSGFSPADFTRTLAKIAFGLAVWKRQAFDFSPTLRQYILTGEGEPQLFIGSFKNPQRKNTKWPMNTFTHRFFIDEVQHSNLHPRYPGRRFLRVRLSLFEEFNELDYHVIVGEVVPPEGAAESVPTGPRLRLVAVRSS